MVDAEGLDARKALLDSVDAEIQSRVQMFEDSIADLRQEHERLRAQYADALRRELTRLDPDAAPAPAPLARILAALEKSPQPVIIKRLRGFAATRGRAQVG